MASTWFIGDIHGEIQLLDRLLEQVGAYGPEQTVFLGDYVDRGPHAREVLDRLMNLDVPHECLLGNHEVMMLNALEDRGYGYSPMELWYRNGAEATLYSFGSSSFFSFRSDVPEKYLDFLRSLKPAFLVDLGSGRKVLATHAGVSPAIPLADQLAMQNHRDHNAYLLNRHLEPDDSFLWSREGFFHSSPDLWSGCVVVHGHTPVPKMQRFALANGLSQFHFVEDDLGMRRTRRENRLVSVDIDSGSTLSGRLTALGFFPESGHDLPSARMKSITVTREEVFPRDLGLVSWNRPGGDAVRH
ncbi:MAG: metallophosphoesterase family protein [Bacteroidales bacterium]